MSESTLTGVADPQPGADDIGARVLKLIDELDSATDLSAERIRQTTGVTLAPTDSDRVHAGGGVVSNGWLYTLLLGDGVKGAGKKNFVFQFVNQDPQASIGAVCARDFDQYADQLKQMGFAQEPFYGSQQNIEYWLFRRGQLVVKVHVRGEPTQPGQPMHLCVNMIEIN